MLSLALLFVFVFFFCLFVFFSVLFSIVITPLGEERVAMCFSCMSLFTLHAFCPFFFLLVSGVGCGL